MPDAISSELKDKLTLALIPGLGPKLTAALMSRFGSAAGIRRATEAELQQVPYIGEKLARQFGEALRNLDLETEIELIAKHHVQLLAAEDSQYPAALAKVETAPPLLYYRGT